MSDGKLTSEITIRLTAQADDVGLIDAWLYHTVERLQKRCESPIEVALAAAMLLHDKFSDMQAFSPLMLAGFQEIGHWEPDTRLLVPQYQFKDYRIDFAIRDVLGMWVFVECDGHDFHERTKEQAARDRKRDRAIQQAGYSIFRFTGSEIHADAIGCAQQILDFSDQQRARA